ncbi:hypothetical protein HFN98_06905 [Rhizobium laguerreae]|uniref:hypothetical protein n=1 Tax=Rhizobium laguerreae TaxID=1076926 RepID=UPI001C9024F9|nr:hypothetical protein [Rhizobium laguerreae]MBY3330377.1 hypothetical protein [Rhizobium laguerreae]
MAEVGDIDLFVSFTTLDLGDDMQPENYDLEDEELMAISKDIFVSSEIDRLTMSDVATRRTSPT